MYEEAAIADLVLSIEVVLLHTTLFNIAQLRIIVLWPVARRSPFALILTNIYPNDFSYIPDDF